MESFVSMPDDPCDECGHIHGKSVQCWNEHSVSECDLDCEACRQWYLEQDMEHAEYEEWE